MANQQYLSEALRQYRQKGAEIGELRQQLGQKMGALTAPEAQREFEELQVHTREFAELRATLDPKDLFLVKYNVVVMNDHTVSFSIPKGCAKIEILHEAKSLVTDRDLIAPRQRDWGQQVGFLVKASSAKRICIDGHVEGGDGLTRAEQRELLFSKGLKPPLLDDLVVAFVVHWIATGGPLFGWEAGEHGRHANWIRATGSWLLFNKMGLDHPHFDDPGTAFDAVGISALIPSP